MTTNLRNAVSNYPPPSENHDKRPATCREKPETIHRLQSTERGEALEIEPFLHGEYEMKVADYRDIEILPASVIYCDIPYFNTREYKRDTFDHKAFYEWCEKQTQPLFISEYWMPEDRFECVAEFKRTSTFSATNNSLKKIERIYRPKHQL